MRHRISQDLSQKMFKYLDVLQNSLSQPGPFKCSEITVEPALLLSPRAGVLSALAKQTMETPQTNSERQSAQIQIVKHTNTWRHDLGRWLVNSLLCQLTVRVKTQLDTGQCPGRRRLLEQANNLAPQISLRIHLPSQRSWSWSCGCSASPSGSVARVRLEQSRGGGSLTGCCRPEFLPASSTTTLFYTLTLCLSSTPLSNTIFCLSSSAICVK